jgi:hypothetical protein
MAFEALEARSMLGAHLVATLSPVTEGRDGRLTVVATVKNTGDQFYGGGDKLFFFVTPENASPYYTYSRNGSGVAVSLGERKLPALSSRGKTKIAMTFDRPAVQIGYRSYGYYPYPYSLALDAGAYYVGTDLTLSTATSSVTRGLRANAPNELVLDGRFGNVQGTNRKLPAGLGATQPQLPGAYWSYTPTNPATFRIDGPGWGELVFDAASAHFVINLHGTTSRSMLIIGGPNSSGTSLHELTINGSVGGIRMDKAFLYGDVRVNGSVGAMELSRVPGGSQPGAYFYGQNPFQLTLTMSSAVKDLRLNDLTYATVNLNGSGPVILHGWNLNEVVLNSHQTVSTLEVKSWVGQESQLRASSIGRLSSDADFSARITAGGTGATALGSANIKGAATAWNLTGNAGDIAVGSIQGLNVVGNLSSLRVERDLNFGNVAATNIGRLDFRGNVGGWFSVLAGANLGADAIIGTNGPGTADSFHGGTIASIEASKNFDAAVLAGVDPHAQSLVDGADRFLDQATFVAGGPSQIGRIVVKGRADGAHFVATSLPTTATLGGANVLTAGNPHFVRSLPA